MSITANLAIQVLPMGIPKDEAYRIVDVAIATIASSGLKYKVCPFETVVEGEYEALIQLINQIQQECNATGAMELLINMKLQRNFEKPVLIEDKMERYP